ncbi:unnamed protein product [Phytomonas sp. EM1]|nr:unnamed protein product [Phytomonas sp. EM1]|eukprot:CCW64249.1 unnamed protein product [Phytomonas sp. isolate EM1]
MFDIAFENGQPTYQSNTIFKCFRDNGNGLLFRIVNEDEKKWAFYNDTTSYNMVVRVVFGKDSEIEALEDTQMSRDEETNEYKCELHIPPLETKMFISGVPNGYRMNFEANPIPK